MSWSGDAAEMAPIRLVMEGPFAQTLRLRLVMGACRRKTLLDNNIEEHENMCGVNG